jgi:hypothetical protein
MARVCGVTGRIAVEANVGAISAVMRYGTEEQKRLAASIVLAGDKPAICVTKSQAGSAATEMTASDPQRLSAGSHAAGRRVTARPPYAGNIGFWHRGLARMRP